MSKVLQLDTKLFLNQACLSPELVHCLMPHRKWGFFFFLSLFAATPVAYGSSQARGQMRAASVTYTTAHGTTGSFNPLSEARDQTHILMDTSQVLNLLSLSGKSLGIF